MTGFFEIDFLDVESAKSGDAIPLRYGTNGEEWVHVVDGGFQDTGAKVCAHIRKHYGNPTYLDHVVATHPDGDHAGGLRTVLAEFEVGTLWMLRPWVYADELLPRFSRFTSVENLRKRLKEIYPNIAALEEIAQSAGIPIAEPFQGASIGAFVVLAPTKGRYLDLVVRSERTPESAERALEEGVGLLARAGRAAVSFLRAAWGEEVFSPEGTSAENEMSVVQFSELFGHKMLLTGDAGREALAEAAAYAPHVGLTLPGIDRFQVPHHGSRRNVSTELLDQWLGPRLAKPPAKGEELFTAFFSASKKDADHPRKAVVRAMIHRGGKAISTEGSDKRTGHNAPDREGWVPVTPLSYPDDQEE
jgi:hypothetical protein